MICKFCDRDFDYDRSKGHRKGCCNSCNTKIRRVRNTLRAIECLGGECERCGYDDHPAALEFHHEGEKEVTIGIVANKSWGEVVKPELESCSLLCSNCHQIEHSDRYDQGFIKKCVEEGRITSPE